MEGGAGNVKEAPLEWKFAQVFDETYAGDGNQEADFISAVEFDKFGQHLATGDSGGRVVLFLRTDIKENGGSRRNAERTDYSNDRHPQFFYKAEFQSHAQEFDCLRSLEIEEKINKIRWCQSVNGALLLLSTNDKTIKLWKVHEKKVKKISEMKPDTSKSSEYGSYSRSSISSGGAASLLFPAVHNSKSRLVSTCKRVYSNAHHYRVNSISYNSDGATFISADDLRIHLWNMEINSQCFNIIDLKPTYIEDLTEVITSAEFHPTHCNNLAYSTSKGSIRLVDLRQSALCDNHFKQFEEPEAPGSRSYYTDLITSISDIKFGKDGRYILSRDYMTLKLWDINMESGPVSTFKVHEYLRPELSDLYENDCIFDKFECCFSGDGQRVATGSYSNLFRVFGTSEGSTEATTVEGSRNPMRRQVQMPSRPSESQGTGLSRIVQRGGESPGLDAIGNSSDFMTRLLYLAWHPSENFIACAVANSLYMYYA
ncbi:serine/threonine protein phosphatase 2A 55 kDa regulatory subunit B beta isoform-like isoform X2 [Apium graveolens]|uniref:serine/threonine protein phosphatase 2A 55 kDa regulatory subunit B beta isoform-like isoform X2 n=1 Tax=Apium graveolens TaxID=4045 RepID=UPI003D7BF5BE